jgi:nitrogen regulatory protein PII
MMMVTAIIQPFRLEHVRRELISAGLLGLTVCECFGHGRQPEFAPSFTGCSDTAVLSPMVKIEIAIPSWARETAIDAIVRGAKLGNSDNGKIFVSLLDKVISIRAGVEDDDTAHLPARPSEAAE